MNIGELVSVKMQLRRMGRGYSTMVKACLPKEPLLQNGRDGQGKRTLLEVFNPTGTLGANDVVPGRPQ